MTFSRRSFLILTAAAVAACKPGVEVLKLSGTTMGTHYNVVALQSGKGVSSDELGRAIDVALAEVNDQMSNWDANSEISRVNAAAEGEAIRLSPALARVMDGATYVHRASEGRFDVTVGPLIDAWGFGAKGHEAHIPDEAAIADAMARSGQEAVLAFEGGELRKTAPGAEIYLAAIGKGYGVDRVAETLRGFGIENFMVEIGGDLYTAGHNSDGTPWQIGIESPVPGQRGLHSVASVSGLGMATSGDYRNYFETAGSRYSHIIDPATGRPILHQTVSTTVLTENAMMADAWATALLVLGQERGMAIAEKEGLAVVFIERDGSSFKTSETSHYRSLQA